MSILGYIIGGVGSIILLIVWFRNEDVVTRGTDEEYKRHQTLMKIGGLLVLIGTLIQVYSA